MKSIVMPNPIAIGTVQLTEKAKDQPATEVKEILEQDAKVNNKTKFTVVDMWNLQRKGCSASDRIRKWNLN